MEVVTGATSSLLPKLGALLREEYNLRDKVKRDIESLQNELIFINAALRKVGGVPPDQLDEQVRTWSIVMRELTYDMEDAASAFMGGVHGHDHPNLGTFTGLFRKAINIFLMGGTHHRIAGMIEEIKRLTTEAALLRDRYRLDNIAHIRVKERAQHVGHRYQLGGFTESHSSEYQMPPPRFGIQKPVVEEQDMWKLEQWMTSEEKELSVLSILGFGGVGKTTVAMALYERYGGQFDHQAMVTVSQNSDPEAALWNILSQLKPQDNKEGQSSMPKGKSVFRSLCSRIKLPGRRSEDDDVSDSGEMHKVVREELQKELSKHRYLLLIDDVWSSFTWQMIQKCLPENHSGSRIIVTTRFQAIATTCSTVHRWGLDQIHVVRVLSEDMSRQLFENSLSAECLATESSQPSKFADRVPEKIWKMCGGLPLAIVTMAGLVASRPHASNKEWLKVCNSLFPGVEICRRPEEFMRIINYCYNDLPNDLKKYSLYLSVFPKGSTISSKRLMRHWISEGFISEMQGLTVEQVAEACFNELIKRKVILPVEYSGKGKVKICRVHDMFLEYITSKADEENFVTVVGSYWSMAIRSSKVRRLSLQSSGSRHAVKADGMSMSHVRSVTVFGSLDQLRFKSLKTAIVQVLDLEGCRDLKDSHVNIIFQMFLLRYLSLRRTDISSLPSKIGDLKYLETLDIRETMVEELPKSVCQLERISSILGGNKKTRKALKLPKEIKKGKMKKLHTLLGIEITEGSSAASNLHEFTKLRKLAIYKLHNSEAIFNDLLSSIQYLGGYALQSLVIDDDESSKFFDNLDFMSSPPIFLTALELSGKLLKLPEWFPNLNELIKLSLPASALSTNTLVILGKLRSLFSLTFSISAANQDITDSGGFISFPDRGFRKLKLLRIFLPLLPQLSLHHNSAPVLQRLELRFKSFQDLCCLSDLGSLQDVLLTVYGEADERTKIILDYMKKNLLRKIKYALIVNYQD